MCLKAAEGYYSSFPLILDLEQLLRRALTGQRPPPLVVGPTINAVVGGRVGGAGERRKVCLCSPTTHPGSFRCRFHHGEYVWCSSMKLRPTTS
ncbi:unnamed protein product [Amaranthus hypochondriacus]